MDASATQYFYGLVSSGHVSGGVNIFPPFLEYDPMEVLNYEAGWKARLADDQFHTQLSVYYETFDDYQANFSEFDVSLPGLNNPTTQKRRDREHRLGNRVQRPGAVRRFSLDFGLAYYGKRARHLQRRPGSVPSRRATPTTDGIPDDVVNLSGAKVPFSPEFTGNIGIAYDFAFGEYTLTPRVDFSHQDETQAALWPDPQVTLEERDLINAQLTFGPDSGTWSAVLWGTNITDEHYISGIQNNGTLYYAAPPAQYGLRLKFNF